MKVIFLNCWYGKLENKLLDFLSSHSKTTDIYCLQEVPIALANKIDTILTNHHTIENRKSNSIYHQNQILCVHNKLSHIVNNSDFLSICLNDKNIIFVNIHGTSLPGHKLDTKERISLSKEIIKFCNKSKHAIIGGDFNLMPRSKSIKILEQNGLINLVREHKIKRTRNIYAWNQAKKIEKDFGHKFYGNQRFSDYCFVTSEVKVKSFEVPDVEVSDHLPLILEFEF